MKENNHTEIICERFCKYYKKGRDELTCGSYNFLNNALTLNELMSKIRNISDTHAWPDFSVDEEMLKTICEQCDFFADGCDFREGLDAPPCGGYIIIERLLKERGSG